MAYPLYSAGMLNWTVWLLLIFKLKKNPTIISIIKSYKISTRMPWRHFTQLPLKLTLCSLDDWVQGWGEPGDQMQGCSCLGGGRTCLYREGRDPLRLVKFKLTWLPLQFATLMPLPRVGLILKGVFQGSWDKKVQKLWPVLAKESLNCRQVIPSFCVTCHSVENANFV